MCDGCKSTLVFVMFSRGFTRYRDTTHEQATGVQQVNTAINQLSPATQ